MIPSLVGLSYCLFFKILPPWQPYILLIRRTIPSLISVYIAYSMNHFFPDSCIHCLFDKLFLPWQPYTLLIQWTISPWQPYTLLIRWTISSLTAVYIAYSMNYFFPDRRIHCLFDELFILWQSYTLLILRVYCPFIQLWEDDIGYVHGRDRTSGPREIVHGRLAVWERRQRLWTLQ